MELPPCSHESPNSWRLGRHICTTDYVRSFVQRPLAGVGTSVTLKQAAATEGFPV